MKVKILSYLREIAVFAVKNILSIDLILMGLAALSFLIWGPFTVTSYSERLIYLGLGLALVGGLLTAAQTTGGRDFGTPGQFIRSAHVQTIIDFNIEARQAIEGRMGIFIRLFVIGVILFGIGALVQVLFG